MSRCLCCRRMTQDDRRRIPILQCTTAVSVGPQSLRLKASFLGRQISTPTARAHWARLPIPVERRFLVSRDDRYRVDYGRPSLKSERQKVGATPAGHRRNAGWRELAGLGLRSTQASACRRHRRLPTLGPLAPAKARSASSRTFVVS